MELKYCENGHAYDPSITPECPECAAKRAFKGTISLNGGIRSGNAAAYGKTMPLVAQPENGSPAAAESYSKTMPVHYGESRPGNQVIFPVAGWIVCREGAEWGKSFPVHEQNNYIGRAESNDICLAADPTVSREHHAVIAYDSRSRVFYFSPSTGASIIYLNGQPVFNTVSLKAYDELEIGKCKFLFIPLCGENFQW